jgi:putative endonuclease
MRDREDIVFIEVRSRCRIDYGTAADTINQRKQRKLIKSATLFLQKCGLLYKVSSRFDVIAIQQTCAEIKLDWIVNAFTGL